MSEKRFVAEQVDVVNEDETEVWDIVFDTENTYAFMVRDTDTASDLCDLLNEQQATIKKLQDLCGESDSENAKLRLKNKELQEEIKLLKPTNVEQYEQIVQLQEENEQLRQQLKEKEEDEQLYANEIVKLNKEAKEVLDFKSLGGDY